MHIQITKENWKALAKGLGMSQRSFKNHIQWELPVTAIGYPYRMRVNEWFKTFDEPVLFVVDDCDIVSEFANGQKITDVKEFFRRRQLSLIADNHKITYRKNYISVGCTPVPVKQIKAILAEHKRLYGKKK